MSPRSTASLFDPLYGDISLSDPFAELLRTPAVQRLRDIRLSNIDSTSMPGIANISRYEHIIGTAYLAGRVGFFGRLSQDDALVLQAAALLHDTAITAFGHLVEEALQYTSAPFDHEMKLSMLLQESGAGEPGGIDMQLYVGYESGIKKWAERTFGTDAHDRIRWIVAAHTGQGRFGACIAGDVDLDNLDNLTRIAFHMGLDVDRALPLRIVAGMIDSTATEGVTFSDECAQLIKTWLDLRRKVYQRLMLSRDDFVGKLMLIYATVTAHSRGLLGPPAYAWTLTDRQLIQHLLQSNDVDISEAVRSWLVNDPWPLSDLLWMRSPVPGYSQLNSFAKIVGQAVGRPCFPYRIVDKRVRAVTLRLRSGKTVQLGSQPDKWVLGIASPKRRPFDLSENRRFQESACDFFRATCLGRADAASTEPLALFH